MIELENPDSKLVRKIQKIILEFEPRAALECIAEHLSHHTFAPAGPNIAGISVVVDDALKPDDIKIVGAYEPPPPAERKEGP